jgi:probable F420-dependent oxidoreductase
MEIGLVIPHIGKRASPGRIQAFCTTAESVGISGLWGVDHVVMPHHTDSDYLLGKAPAKISDGAVSNLMSPNYEIMTTLTWVAACTTSISVGSSVAVLPIRNTLMTARQLATLDVFSGGRVTLGVGAGWLKEEADSMGMPWADRGRRLEEQVAVLRAIWCAQGDLVEFHGHFHDVSPMDPEPRPQQQPIPIYIGGHSDIALERAGRIGDGWIAGSMPADAASANWSRVRASAEASDRNPAKLRLVVQASLRPGQPLLDQVNRYFEIGVDHLQIPIAIEDPEAELDFIREIGDVIVPAVVTDAPSAAEDTHR